MFKKKKIFKILNLYFIYLIKIKYLLNILIYIF